jgi:tetratricopeptide (TPR) repeat protein
MAMLAGCQAAPLGEGLLEPGAGPAPPPAAPTATPAPAATPTAAATSTAGLLDVLDRPAERALLAGMRAYDDGQYAESENQLKRALDANLRSARDRAAAHKQLAFIYCTTARVAQCELEFRAALRADPSFSLTRGEAGHPMWGPVYKRVKGP